MRHRPRHGNAPSRPGITTAAQLTAADKHRLRHAWGGIKRERLYFGSIQLALEHDAAPMRIPFNRIPDAKSGGGTCHDALWLQSLNRFMAITEGQHRRRERGDSKG